MDILKTAINKTNSRARSIDTARNGLFSVVRESVDLIGGDAEMIKQYRKGIEAQRSTVFMMMKVVSDPLIRRLESCLPESYATLYELLKLNADIGEERFIELVETGVIDRETTKKRVTELRKEAKSATSSSNEFENGNASVADLDERRTPLTSDYDELIDRFESLEDSAREEFIAYVMTSLAKKEAA